MLPQYPVLFTDYVWLYALRKTDCVLLRVLLFIHVHDILYILLIMYDYVPCVKLIMYYYVYSWLYTSTIYSLLYLECRFSNLDTQSII